jgi:hypothetical protein
MGTDVIKFECPTCGATHERGFVNGVDAFRCLRCGYSGYGFHSDPVIDKEVYIEHLANNKVDKSLGLETVPLGVDLSMDQGNEHEHK